MKKLNKALGCPQSSFGFSLIEMMVVIFLVAVLSMIASSQYRIFKSKALQKEGLSLLNQYYLAAAAAKAEFSVYPGNLVQMTGFRPAGKLHYRLHSQDGTDIPIAFNDNTCQTTGGLCDCGGACPSQKTWEEHPLGTIGAVVGPHPISGGFCPDALGNGCGGRFTNDDNYAVKISAVISTSASMIDCFYMTDQKVILQCTNGIE